MVNVKTPVTTKNYIVKDLLNPLLLIAGVVFAFVNLYIFLFLCLTYLLYLSWENNLITVSDEGLGFKYPYWFLSDKQHVYPWDTIIKLTIKKNGEGGYGSLPYFEIYHEVREQPHKKVITYSPSLNGKEFQELEAAIRAIIGERLVIDERQP